MFSLNKHEAHVSRGPFFCLMGGRAGGTVLMPAQAADGVDGEEGESGPDAAEADDMGGGEGLAVDEDADEELSRRGDVLQEAEGGQGDPLGGFTIQKQGDGGDGAGQEQEQPGERLEGVEGRVALGVAVNDKGNRGGRHPEGLHREGRGGVESHLFLQETVDAEAESQSDGDNREVAVVDGEIEYAGQCQDECHGLRPVEPFAEEEASQQYVDEWVDIIAQTALEDVAVVDGPDVQSPVEGDECAGEQEHQVLPEGADMLPEPHVADADEEGDHEHGRPYHAMSEDFEAVDMVEQPPVEREQPPDGVAEQSVDQSFAVGAHIGLLQWPERSFLRQ